MSLMPTLLQIKGSKCTSSLNGWTAQYQDNIIAAVSAAPICYLCEHVAAITCFTAIFFEANVCDTLNVTAWIRVRTLLVPL